MNFCWLVVSFLRPRLAALLKFHGKNEGTPKAKKTGDLSRFTFCQESSGHLEFFFAPSSFSFLLLMECLSPAFPLSFHSITNQLMPVMKGMKWKERKAGERKYSHEKNEKWLTWAYLGLTWAPSQCWRRRLMVLKVVPAYAQVKGKTTTYKILFFPAAILSFGYQYFHFPTQR